MTRLFATIVIAALTCGNAYAQVTTDAENSAAAVMQQFGTPQALEAQGAQPLSTDTVMRTVDGQTAFNAKVACRESEEFMRVTMVPSGTMDIDQLLVELDMDMDGTRETINTVPGPFAGVCINGMVRCDSGTFNNCQMQRWQASAAGVGLVPATTRDVGACYCFNGSCGANLLMVNNQKILTDISTGVSQAIGAVQPRLVVGRTSLVDPLSMTQFGQLASCGTDSQPEQYYTNSNALPAAGAAAALDPNSPASILRASPVSAEHGMMTTGRCAIERRVPFERLSKSDILQMTGVSRGGTFDCGPGCVEFFIGGEAGGTYQSGAGRNACRYAPESMSIGVFRPDRIDSVNLTYGTADGFTRLGFNGTEVANMQPGWTWPGVPWANCPRGPSAPWGMSNDIRSFFANAGIVNADFAIAYDDWGNGSYHFQARVREGCELLPEEIDNGCASYEANTECSVMSETVDGVMTVNNHLTTGLAPLPTDRIIGAPACTLNSGPKPWWRTERVYTCRTGTPATYDGREARRRADVVQDSANMGAGTYSDERQLTPGAYTTSGETITFPTAPYAPRTRTMVCKTVKPRPGIEIADGQAVNNLNVTGVANDFTFKECTDAGVCPLEAGETMVTACSNASNFAQAAAMMQTVRQIGQDTQCVAP